MKQDIVENHETNQKNYYSNIIGMHDFMRMLRKCNLVFMCYYYLSSTCHKLCFEFIVEVVD